MKYTKYILISLLILGLLLAAGCKSGKPSTTATQRGWFSKKGSETGLTFIGGVGNLEMQFTENRPPASVYVDTDFEVEVELLNDGEWIIPKDDITLTLSGVSPQEFGLSDLIKKPDSDLIPKKKDSEGNIIPPEAQYVVWTLNHKDKVVGNLPFPLQVDACYKYGTNAVTTLCILKDFTKAEENQVCYTNENKDFANSRAPIQIANVRQYPEGKKKTAFVFDVVHNGNGKFYKIGSNCDQGSTLNIAKVYVEIDSGVNGFECSGLKEGSCDANGACKGYADLRKDKDTIMCSLNINSATDYAKQVNIKLTYDYKQTINSQIVVKQS